MRSINTTRKKIIEVTKNNDSAGRIVRGSLAEDYNGIGKTARVRMGYASGSITVQARVNSLGAINTTVPEGSPVTLRITRGKPEIIAFGFAGVSTIRAMLERAAAQTAIGSNIGSLTPVTFGSGDVVIDTNTIFDNANDTLVVPITGNYMIWAYTQWAAGGGSRRQVIELNGALKWEQSMGGLYTNAAPPVVVSRVYGITQCTEYPLTEDDTIGLYVAHNHGSNLDLDKAILGIRLVN